MKRQSPISLPLPGIIVPVIIAAIGGAYYLGKDNGNASSEREIIRLSIENDNLKIELKRKSDTIYQLDYDLRIQKKLSPAVL